MGITASHILLPVALCSLFLCRGLLFAGEGRNQLQPLAVKEADSINLLELGTFGHKGVVEALTAIHFLAQIAKNWNLKNQGLAQDQLEIDPFLNLLRRGGGFETYASIGLSYFSLEQGDLKNAEILAKALLEGDPTHIQTSFALAFLYHHFLDKPAEAGALYIRLAEHPEIPEWVRELGQKLEGTADVPEGDDLQLPPNVRQTLCATLTASAPAESREILLKKCSNKSREQK